MSHETIYSAVYMVPRRGLRTLLVNVLRQSHTKRMPWTRGTSRRGSIANLASLNERPAEVDSREVPGHWERNFIKDTRNASAIDTAVERHSRFVLLTQMTGCTATHSLQGFSRRFNGVIPELRKSLRLRPRVGDGAPRTTHRRNRHAGLLLRAVQPVAPRLQKNTNGLVRQFLPKAMNLFTVTPQKLAYVESMLNDRLRKVLGFRTPREVCTEIIEKHRTAQLKQSAEIVALQG